MSSAKLNNLAFKGTASGFRVFEGVTKGKDFSIASSKRFKRTLISLSWKGETDGGFTDEVSPEEEGETTENGLLSP